jgi:hypothetical protein
MELNQRGKNNLANEREPFKQKPFLGRHIEPAA